MHLAYWDLITHGPPPLHLPHVQNTSIPPLVGPLDIAGSITCCHLPFGHWLANPQTLFSQGQQNEFVSDDSHRPAIGFWTNALSDVFANGGLEQPGYDENFNYAFLDGGAPHHDVVGCGTNTYRSKQVQKSSNGRNEA